MPRSGPIVHIDAEVERRVLEREEALRGGLGGLGLLPDLLELRPHQTAEVGQVGEVALAPEQEPAELVLELLDRAGQRRLGDVAVLRGAGEVQGRADREEVADLMHLHHGSSRPAGKPCSGSIKLIHSRHLHYRQARDQIVISLPPELAAGGSAGRPFPGAGGGSGGGDAEMAGRSSAPGRREAARPGRYSDFKIARSGRHRVRAVW